MKRMGACNFQRCHLHHDCAIKLFSWLGFYCKSVSYLLEANFLSICYSSLGASFIFSRIIYQQKTMTKSYSLWQKILNNLIYCDTGSSKNAATVGGFWLSACFLSSVHKMFNVTFYLYFLHISSPVCLFLWNASIHRLADVKNCG